MESEEEVFENNEPSRVDRMANLVVDSGRIEEATFEDVGFNRWREPTLDSYFKKLIFGHSLTIRFVGQHQISEYPKEGFQIVKVIVQGNVLGDKIAAPEGHQRLEKVCTLWVEASARKAKRC
jgi:hypothetical protein